SSSLRTNHRARLCAASKCGNISASNDASSCSWDIPCPSGFFSTNKFTTLFLQWRSSSLKGYSIVNTVAIEFFQRSFRPEYNPLRKGATNLSFHAAQLADNPLPLKPDRARTSQHCDDVQQAPAGPGGEMPPDFR